MSDQRQEEYESTPLRIAQSMSAKEYFLNEESKLLDDWADKSLAAFTLTGEVFKKQYELKSENLIDTHGRQYEQLYVKSTKEFEAYCILNRKVQKKSDQIQNFANFLNSKNVKKNFFSAWKGYSDKQKYIRRMEDAAEKHKQKWILRSCLKEWSNMTMKSNRVRIKNEVLHKTEIEISKIQNDYEKLIKSLEETLEKKLIELKKEEEEHKLLHDKYETMYSRGKVEANFS